MTVTTRTVEGVTYTKIDIDRSIDASLSISTDAVPDPTDEIVAVVSACCGGRLTTVCLDIHALDVAIAALSLARDAYRAAQAAA